MKELSIKSRYPNQLIWAQWKPINKGTLLVLTFTSGLDWGDKAGTTSIKPTQWSKISRY